MLAQVAPPTAPRLERNSEPPSRKYFRIARLDRGGMADVYLALARGPLEFRKLLVVKCLRAVAQRSSSRSSRRTQAA